MKKPMTSSATFAQSFNQKTRESCGCFQGCVGDPEENSGTISGATLEILQKRECERVNHMLLATREGKPAPNLGPTLHRKLSPPSVRVFRGSRHYSLLEFF